MITKLYTKTTRKRIVIRFWDETNGRMIGRYYRLYRIDPEHLKYSENPVDTLCVYEFATGCFYDSPGEARHNLLCKNREPLWFSRGGIQELAQIFGL